MYICIQKRWFDGVVTVRARHARLRSPWYIMRSNMVMISRLPGHPHVKYARARVCVCVCGFVRVTQNRNCSAKAGGGGVLGGCVGRGI